MLLELVESVPSPVPAGLSSTSCRLMLTDLKQAAGMLPGWCVRQPPVPRLTPWLMCVSSSEVFEARSSLGAAAASEWIILSCSSLLLTPAAAASGRMWLLGLASLQLKPDVSR